MAGVSAASSGATAPSAALTGGFGAHGALGVSPGAAILAATLAELLAYEFGYWASHYAFHRIPALWEFHKVHHSAEVMTTFTEMRQHPVEIVVFMNAIALCTGLTFGLMTYAVRPGVGHMTLLNGNIVLTLFMLTWGHLRHSHMWISVPGPGRQTVPEPGASSGASLHRPRHFDKNLGFALAVWDWAFGTLAFRRDARADRVRRRGRGGVVFAPRSGSAAAAAPAHSPSCGSLPRPAPSPGRVELRVAERDFHARLSLP